MSAESFDMMGDAWDALKAAFNTFKSQPSERPPFIGTVAAGPGDALVQGLNFLHDTSYFGVRLVEMHLAEGGRYFTKFLPMGVCVAEYTFGTERRRVPVVLSNETVQAMLGEVRGRVGAVKIIDMPIIRRTPFKEDNLSLFVGLFRMPYSDIAKSVLQLAADVSGDLGATPIQAGAQMAGKIYNRVCGLFRLNEVVAQFAYLDGMALGQSGYVLVSGPLPKEIDPQDFMVANRRLALRAGSKTAQEWLDKIDYCLIAFEQRSSLFDAGAELSALSSLPFHADWRKTTQLLAQRKAADAEELLLSLRSQVMASPDLTEQDRLLAVGVYDAGYETYAKSLLAKPGSTTRAMRSATPATGLLRQIGGLDGGTAGAVKAIATYFQSPTGDQPVDADTVLASAFTALREPLTKAHEQGARAALLANALSVGTTGSR